MIPKLHVKNALNTKHCTFEGGMFSFNCFKFQLTALFLSFSFFKEFAILFLFSAASVSTCFFFLLLLLLVFWNVNGMGIFFLYFVSKVRSRRGLIRLFLTLCFVL